jgi:hypothetical protein
VGDATVVRPVVDGLRLYHTETTTGTTASHYDETTWTLAWHSEAGSELMLETVTTNNPAVSTSNNGSGSYTTVRRHYDKQGRVDWERLPDGVLNYTEYTGGVRTKSIRDADEDDATDFPTNIAPTGFDSAAAAVHRRDSYAADAQGRTTETTLAEGRITKGYVSDLADRRLISLSYPKYTASSETYWGPVQFRVTNLAGQVEVQGTIGLTSSTTALASHVDETDSDPLLALGIGTQARSHWPIAPRSSFWIARPWRARLPGPGSNHPA